MPKILSQSGISLADAYDVEGSIVGVDQLDSSQVSLVHEMGQTIFSERFSGVILREASSATLQDVNIDLPVTGLPMTPSRIIAIRVSVGTTARMLRAAVMARDPTSGREMPLWVWDGTNETTIRIADEGPIVDMIVLNPDPIFTLMPNMLTGVTQPRRVDEIILRARTSSFGAGDVNMSVAVFILFSELEGISSFGVPIPSW